MCYHFRFQKTNIQMGKSEVFETNKIFHPLKNHEQNDFGKHALSVQNFAQIEWGRNQKIKHRHVIWNYWLI